METYEKRRTEYYKQIALGTMTTGRFEDKMELFYLICFLTQQLQKKDPVKYSNPINVLNFLFDKKLKDEDTPENFKDYIYSLGIICEDLLYAVEDIKNTGYKNSKDIILRIKQLIEQWIPF